MVGMLILVAAAGLVWAYWSGRLKGFSYEDVAAGLAFLLGLKLLISGRLVAGSAVMAGSLLWAAWRRGRSVAPTMPLDDARRLLGVGPDASLAQIRDAHRRLISKVHPDSGGSAELANRVNVARDALIADITRRAPRAQ